VGRLPGAHGRKASGAPSPCLATVPAKSKPITPRNQQEAEPATVETLTRDGAAARIKDADKRPALFVARASTSDDVRWATHHNDAPDKLAPGNENPTGTHRVVRYLAPASGTAGPDKEKAHQHSESEGAHLLVIRRGGKDCHLGQCSGMTPERAGRISFQAASRSCRSLRMMAVSSGPLNEGSADPLGYLDPYERALCGWAVRRAFALRTAKFARGLDKYGSRGMAYYCCIQALLAYCFPLVIAGFVTALHPDLSHVFFILIGVALLLAARRILSLHRAGKEYRQSHL